MKTKKTNTLTKVTPFSKVIAFILFLAFPIAGFCLGMQYQRIMDINAVSSVSVLQKNTVRIVPITLLDMGQTKYVRVGDEIQVALGNKFNWIVSVDNPSVLQHVSTDPYLYKAVAPGTATISGAGRPACKAGQLCSMMAVSFKSMVVVK